MREQSRIVFRSVFRMKVSERASGRLVGYVGDISERGIKILTDEALERGTLMRLRLRMRNGEGAIVSVDVDAECLWCRANTKSGYYESGVHIGQPGEAFTQLVEGLRKRRKIS
ncbi:PilZ domain-containing protein [Pseudomonas profundi]|uniref:PilZ domain-containing protein n=1 Tax=Pseudomonas profundi TaxID=1981513 RepID=UPI00123A5C22|nr:PilZ domain-containing protein [Pseudomonas profundi]